MILRNIGKVNVRVDDLSGPEALQVDKAIQLMKRISDGESAPVGTAILSALVVMVTMTPIVCYSSLMEWSAQTSRCSFIFRPWPSLLAWWQSWPYRIDAGTTIEMSRR